MSNPATLSKNQVTIAYLRMSAARFPDKTLVDALAEADALTAELAYPEGDQDPNPTSEAAGGGTAKNIPPELAEGIRVLTALHTENAVPVNIASFCEGMELQRDPAEKLLKKIAAAGFAITVKRGRGTAYIPADKLQEPTDE